ncbi:MAG TPA: imidazole glycerol phosphate synthase subunit HisH [Solirubrobacteraceae bacterium]|nr:imidazole glycerol phosphate synthase subunit HisH [Solirubrobacteraceae bacterium]
MTRVVVADIGLSNIASLLSAGVAVGQPFIGTTDPGDAAGADRLILPGVGNFTAAMDVLERTGWAAAIQDAVRVSGTPVLGICLGMHLLADRGFEGGTTPGLGLVPGEVRLMPGAPGMRIPHVGWNEVVTTRETPLFAGIPQHTDFYFVHSYEFRAADEGDVLGRTPYADDFASVVSRDDTVGVQFHPEKSSKAGLRLLANWVETGATHA